MAVYEEWTPEQIMAARKVFRRNGTVEEALQAMGSQMALKSAKVKLRRYGMAFRVAPRLWEGTSVEARKQKQEVEHG